MLSATEPRPSAPKSPLAQLKKLPAIWPVLHPAQATSKLVASCDDRRATRRGVGHVAGTAGVGSAVGLGGATAGLERHEQARYQKQDCEAGNLEP